jgi:hypothetical protein
MPSAAEYDAFISYSHRLDQLGPQLQSGLQRFAKPWYRLRALRVFCDTANLSANPGLWESIEEALSNSRWFLLLTSADAAQSHWVTARSSGGSRIGPWTICSSPRPVPAWPGISKARTGRSTRPFRQPCAARSAVSHSGWISAIWM